MGAQYLRPPDGHRGCDCDYPQCRKMGYFPSSQGALQVPASARDVTLRSPNLFLSPKRLELKAIKRRKRCKRNK